MNIENMTYDDARVYRCEMTYKSNVSGSIFSIEKNATLIIVEVDNKTDGRAVSGLNFTLSKTRVIVGTTIELLMTCQITEVDVVVYHMAIRRETNSGWQTMAHIEAGVTEVPALNNDIVDDKGFIVGGTLDKENPLNTHITLEMNIEKMTYDDARVYRFEMTYKSNVSGSIFSIEKNATLIIVGADNKTEEQTGTLQNSECVSKTTSVIVGVILGVVIILTTVYASYLTVVIRRIKDRNQHCARCIMLEATSTNDRREIQNSSDEI